MTDYTKSVNFTAKDALPTGDSGKIVRGSEIDTELSNVATAVNSKANKASPTFTGTVTAPTVNVTTTFQIGGVSVTATSAELNTLDGITASTAELNILDGVTASAAELNYLVGVTSAIQTQLNAKQGTLTNTDGLTEGATNLYYTDTRVNSAIDTRVDKIFVDALDINAAQVDGKSVAVVTSLPGSPDADTIYFVTG